MKYRNLIESKLESLHNIQTTIDSLTAISAPKNEIKQLVNRAKDIILEIQSLIQKEE
jgi:hypothetical protein